MGEDVKGVVDISGNIIGAAISALKGFLFFESTLNQKMPTSIHFTIQFYNLVF